MFHPIQIPFGAAMLFNIVNLKEGVAIEDVELALGEMCNVVKNTYGNEEGGFIAGQVYKYAGFISNEGSFENDNKKKLSQYEIVIVTFWKSFKQHEISHTDTAFKAKFDALLEFCDETHEIGYEMLWQGVPE